jgi:pimeloyl-ACP methyl ester carboxylesterase
MSSSVRAFSVDAAERIVGRILRRLADSSITYAPEDDTDWRYGTDAAYLRDFVRYWLQDYDWRAAVRELNRYPQYRCAISGVEIHFIHIRGAGKARRPTLLLTHGWPGSTYEFHAAAERLAFPERFGGEAEAGFDLVIPSLPGYGFSGRPRGPIGMRRVAAMWRSLMVDHLGIERFGVQGGDIGSAVSTWLANDAPQHVAALHFNLCMPPPRSKLDPDEAAWRERAMQKILSDGAYWLEQATRPQTIALALADNPLGYAAWVLEKFHGWGDTGGVIESRFSRDWLITNLMIHLVNDATTSMIWMYRASAEDQGSGDQLDVKVPTAAAVYPADWLPWPTREIAERYYAIRRWREMPSGGHFAALEEPALFAEDLSQFFNEFMR